MESSTEMVPRSDAKKHQDHKRRQAQTDAAFAQHIGNGNLHVLRLIEDHVAIRFLGMSSSFLMRLRTPSTIWIVLLLPPCAKWAGKPTSVRLRERCCIGLPTNLRHARYRRSEDVVADCL